jgi:hypothetical protein
MQQRRCSASRCRRCPVWAELCNNAVSIGNARASGAPTLNRDHFVDYWARKANVNAFATPFTHDGYESMFRPDKPFQVFVS